MAARWEPKVWGFSVALSFLWSTFQLSGTSAKKATCRLMPLPRKLSKAAVTGITCSDPSPSQAGR